MVSGTQWVIDTHWSLLFLWFHRLPSSDDVVWRVPSPPWLALLCMSSVCWIGHLPSTSFILLDLPWTSAMATTHSSAKILTHFLLTKTSSQSCTVSLPSFLGLLWHYWIPRNLLAPHTCAMEKCRADKCMAPPVTKGNRRWIDVTFLPFFSQAGILRADHKNWSNNRLLALVAHLVTLLPLTGFHSFPIHSPVPQKILYLQVFVSSAPFRWHPGEYNYVQHLEADYPEKHSFTHSFKRCLVSSYSMNETKTSMIFIFSDLLTYL